MFLCMVSNSKKVSDKVVLVLDKVVVVSDMEAACWSCTGRSSTADLGTEAGIRKLASDQLGQQRRTTISHTKQCYVLGETKSKTGNKLNFIYMHLFTEGNMGIYTQYRLNRI
jgi:hypothetical protein